jgi:hypothetical protein
MAKGPCPVCNTTVTRFLGAEEAAALKKEK